MRLVLLWCSRVDVMKVLCRWREGAFEGLFLCGEATGPSGQSLSLSILEHLLPQGSFSHHFAQDRRGGDASRGVETDLLGSAGSWEASAEEGPAEWPEKPEVSQLPRRVPEGTTVLVGRTLWDGEECSGGFWRTTCCFCLQLRQLIRVQEPFRPFPLLTEILFPF